MSATGKDLFQTQHMITLDIIRQLILPIPVTLPSGTDGNYILDFCDRVSPRENVAGVDEYKPVGR